MIRRLPTGQRYGQLSEPGEPTASQDAVRRRCIDTPKWLYRRYRQCSLPLWKVFAGHLQSWPRCGRLRIACNALCLAARFHSAEENPGCLLTCREGLDCTRHYNRCSTLFDSPANVCHLRRFSTICCSKFLSEATDVASLLLGFLTRSSLPTTYTKNQSWPGP